VLHSGDGELFVKSCRRALLALGAVLGLSGCFPFTWPATPAVEARVVDATTQRPIPGALVTVWNVDHPDDFRAEARSDADGRVSLAKLDRTVWLPPLPFDPGWPDARVRWEAPGYAAQEELAYTLFFGPGGSAAQEPKSPPLTLPLTPTAAP